jgi:argininosuccinate lyase
MKAALASSMMATDLADYLVEKGASFREAHAAVGKLVREAEEKRCELTTLPFESFSSAHARFERDVFDALSAVRSVERREAEGGTGPGAVRSQIEAARGSLTERWDNTRGNELRLVTP